MTYGNRSVFVCVSPLNFCILPYLDESGWDLTMRGFGEDRDGVYRRVDASLLSWLRWKVAAAVEKTRPSAPKKEWDSLNESVGFWYAIRDAAKSLAIEIPPEPKEKPEQRPYAVWTWDGIHPLWDNPEPTQEGDVTKIEFWK